MITSDIILRYELQVDDASELSSAEELALANEVYTEICDDRPWEWSKTTATGTTSTSVPYIALPADFKELSLNRDNRSVIFVGTDYAEYLVIPFSSRRDYRDMDGFAYIDIATSRLYFTKQPTTAKTIEYDYVKIPAALTAPTAPLVTTDQFGKLIAYGMAAKFNNIELSDKGSSYQRENQVQYYNILSDMRIIDSNIKLSM
jgi:hypothetical protein